MLFAHETLRFCPLPCYPTYLTGQTGPEGSPGLRVPGTSMPYALDSFDGKPELVPIHHSSVTVNNHPGANVAGAMAGSFFYKPKVTTELPGAAAAVTLRSRRPVLYFHLDGQDDPGADHNENLVGWAIVRAKPDKDRRIVGQIRITLSRDTASTAMTSSTRRKTIFRMAGRRLRLWRT